MLRSTREIPADRWLILDGEVIGINTAILSETNAYAGVGFSLPSNTVVQVYNQLIGPEHRVARGSIGIMFDAVENPAITRVYGKWYGRHDIERSSRQPGPINQV